MVDFLVELERGRGEPPASRDAERVNKLADEYVAESLHRFPENAVFAGMEPPGFDHFSDNSLAALAAWQHLEDDWLSALAGIDANALYGKPEWITSGFLREALAASRGLRVCRNELWHVSQMDGWQVALPELAAARSGKRHLSPAPQAAHLKLPTVFGARR